MCEYIVCIKNLYTDMNFSILYLDPFLSREIILEDRNM